MPLQMGVNIDASMGGMELGSGYFKIRFLQNVMCANKTTLRAELTNTPPNCTFASSNGVTGVSRARCVLHNVCWCIASRLLPCMQRHGMP